MPNHFNIREASRANERGGFYVYQLGSGSMRLLEVWSPTLELARELASALNRAMGNFEKDAANVPCAICGHKLDDHIDYSYQCRACKAEQQPSTIAHRFTVRPPKQRRKATA